MAGDPPLEQVLSYLQGQHAAGVRVFTTTPLVYAGVVSTGDAARLALLSLAKVEILKAFASIRCARGHRMGEVPYTSEDDLPRNRCRKCWEEDERVDEGDGGVVLTFSPGARFPARLPTVGSDGGVPGKLTASSPTVEEATHPRSSPGKTSSTSKSGSSSTSKSGSAVWSPLALACKSTGH